VWIMSNKRTSQNWRILVRLEKYNILDEIAKNGIEVDEPCGSYLTSVSFRIGEF